MHDVFALWCPLAVPVFDTGYPSLHPGGTTTYSAAVELRVVRPSIWPTTGTASTQIDVRCDAYLTLGSSTRWVPRAVC